MVISGTSLLGHGKRLVSVLVCGVAATITHQSTVSIHVTIEAHGSNKEVTGPILLTSNTGATITKPNAWQYVERGEIKTVTPGFGQVGTEVVIEGTNLLGGAESFVSVTLHGVKANIVGQSNTKIELKVNVANTIGKGDVHLITDSGAFITQKDAWTYVTDGDINRLLPSRGQAGTIVDILGTGMLGGGVKINSLTLAGVPVAEIKSFSDSKIRVTVAPSTKKQGDVVIIADSGAKTVQANGWNYVDVGVINDISPASGQRGTLARISGSHMLSGAEKIAAVTLAGVNVWKIIDSSDKQVTVVVARSANAVSGGDVVMVAQSGAVVSKAGIWTYLEEGEITAVEPSYGQGGTYVQITGHRLHGGGDKIIAVTLADKTAQILAQSKAVTTGNTTAMAYVSVRAAISAAGRGHVVLTSNTGALVTFEDKWEYTEPGVIESISPSIGQLNTLVTISGTWLAGNGPEIKTITLSGVVAKVESSALPKKGSDGKGTVVVRAAASTKSAGTTVTILSKSGAIVTVAGKWNYAAEGKIAAVVPNVGHFGTKVAITGTSLLASGKKVISVVLAGVAAKLVNSSNSQIKVIAQTGSVKKTGDVVITADTEATVTLADGWSYTSPGVVSALNPSSGQFGTKVVISGSGLRGSGKKVVSVTLGGTSVASIDSESDTEVIVAAAKAPGSGTKQAVVLTADSGAVITGEAKWQYLDQGTVNSVLPAVGRLGTLVTISGERLLGGDVKLATVHFLQAVKATSEPVRLIADTTSTHLNSLCKILAQTDTKVIIEVTLTSIAGAVDIYLTAKSGRSGVNQS